MMMVTVEQFTKRAFKISDSIVDETGVKRGS